MIAFSPHAADKVREVAATLPEAAGKTLRLFIQGVGCSGFSYGFAFDDQRDDDTVVESEGVKVLVDPASAPHLEGAAVDFVDDHRGTGFVVSNPNSPQGSDCSSGGCCGCGP
jgi:iron-sulfur cluster assembly accessory protein